MHSHLKIRNSEDIEQFMEYQTEEWQNLLPRSYHIWRRIIIELVIIWTVTAGVDHDIPYAQYMEIRNGMLPLMNTIYEETEASKIYSSNNEVPGLVESPQSSTPSPPF